MNRWKPEDYDEKYSTKRRNPVWIRKKENNEKKAKVEASGGKRRIIGSNE